MYQGSYAEVMDDTPQAARKVEREAIEYCIELLEAAEVGDAHSPKAVEAILFTVRLWTIFLEDLCKPSNELAPSLRADLVSIGIYALKEAEEIRQGNSTNFRILIDIFQALALGLRA